MEHDNETHDHFNRALAHAMRRVDAPRELLDRIYAIPSEANTKRGARNGVLALGRSFFIVPSWAMAAMAAVLIAAGSFGGVAHVRHVRERAEATRQFEVATEIEQQTLARTREQLRAAGVDLGQ